MEQRTQAAFGAFKQAAPAWIWSQCETVCEGGAPLGPPLSRDQLCFSYFDPSTQEDQPPAPKEVSVPAVTLK